MHHNIHIAISVYKCTNKAQIYINKIHIITHISHGERVN